MSLIDDYLKKIERGLQSAEKKVKAVEIGIVSEIKDGVVFLDGLDEISYGELIQFEQQQIGYVIDIGEFNVGAIILGDYLQIKSGDKAKALGYTLSIPVSDKLIGRVIDSLANPLDNQTKIQSKELYPLEKIAPNVVSRVPVSQPVQTGIKAI